MLAGAVKYCSKILQAVGLDSGVATPDPRARTAGAPPRSKLLLLGDRNIVVSVGEAEVNRGKRDSSIITLTLPEPLEVEVPANSTWRVKLHPYLIGLPFEIVGDFTFPEQRRRELAPKTVMSEGYYIQCVMAPGVLSYSCRPMEDSGVVDTPARPGGLIHRAALEVSSIKSKYGTGVDLQVRVDCHDTRMLMLFVCLCVLLRSKTAVVACLHACAARHPPSFAHCGDSGLTGVGSGVYAVASKHRTPKCADGPSEGGCTRRQGPENAPG
jgi:hypothetical protein